MLRVICRSPIHAHMDDSMVVFLKYVLRTAAKAQSNFGDKMRKTATEEKQVSGFETTCVTLRSRAVTSRVCDGDLDGDITESDGVGASLCSVDEPRQGSFGPKNDGRLLFTPSSSPSISQSRCTGTNLQRHRQRKPRNTQKKAQMKSRSGWISVGSQSVNVRVPSCSLFRRFSYL